MKGGGSMKKYTREPDTFEKFLKDNDIAYFRVGNDFTVHSKTENKHLTIIYRETYDTWKVIEIKNGQYNGSYNQYVNIIMNTCLNY